MKPAYYNEFDKNAAAWLRELIKAGLIAPGEVDERSIEDVLPNDLAGYTQCHFFAGIGVWSYALRKSGWPDDRPVWTGSCPCQPFSAAGKGAAFDDERHLWPAFHHLIKERRPVVVFGEQVASKDADSWIDLVQTDLEGVGYTVGAVPFPSAGVGAPHIRDRMYWVAESGVTLGDAGCKGLERHAGNGCATGRKGSRGSASEDGLSGSVADTESVRQPGQSIRSAGGLSPNGVEKDGSTSRLADLHVNGCDQARPCVATTGSDGVVRNGAAFGMDNSISIGRGAGRNDDAQHDRQQLDATGDADRPGATNGFWRASDWLGCRDGKFRPVEPGTFPLVNGASARVVRLRGYGNAINAIQAQTWIEAFMECRP